jgi:lysophospholipase L1-like esterase
MANIPVIAEINTLLDANDVTIAKAALGVLGAATTGNASIVNADISDTAAINVSKLTGVQASLVSGTNIRTVNGSTLLGSTDLVISGGVPAIDSITTAMLQAGAVTAVKTNGLQSSLFVGTNNNFIFEGDSITSGSNNTAGFDYPTLLMALPTFNGKGTKSNFAVQSSFIANMVARYAGSVYPLRPAVTGVPAYLFVLCGTNNINTFTSADIITALESYWSTAKADGFIVIAYTITPQSFTGANELKRQQINAAIRLSNTWDYLVDTAALLPDMWDTGYYIDKLHPTDAGNRVIAREVESVIINKRKSPMPDVTATRAISRGLRLGGSMFTVSAQTLIINDETVGTGSSTTGGTITSSVTPIADAGFNHTNLLLSTSQLGSFGYQYLTGLQSLIRLKTAKSITDGIAFSAQNITDSGGGVINNAICFQALSPAANSGAIVSAYGLQVKSQKNTNVTNGIGIQVEGTNDLNYIVGKLRVGSLVAPTRALDVTGEFGVTTGSITTETIGKTVGIKSGTNALSGTFTANGATPVAVATTAWDANCVAVITLKTIGGTVTSQPFVSSVTAGAGTGFSVTSAAGDTSTYNWVALKVN